MRLTFITGIAFFTFSYTDMFPAEKWRPKINTKCYLLCNAVINVVSIDILRIQRKMQSKRKSTKFTAFS